MALPIIAAGIAARAVASKLASRAIGGITGAGAKQVTPVYRNISNETKGIAKNSVKKAYYAEKEAAALGKSFENNKGSLPWPVNKGTITEGFGKSKYTLGVSIGLSKAFNTVDHCTLLDIIKHFY